jgi:hypothetical protein
MLEHSFMKINPAKEGFHKKDYASWRVLRAWVGDRYFLGTRALFILYRMMLTILLTVPS